MGRAHEVRKESAAKTAAAKSLMNGRASKEIYYLAKTGGTDLKSNLLLRAAVEKAKAKKVSSDTIKRAIEKAKGSSEESFLQCVYEGFSKEGSLFLVKTLTSNVNRTIANIKSIFKKNDSKLGVLGSVSYQFKEVASFIFRYENFERLFNYVLEKDLNILNLEEEPDGVHLTAPFQDYNHIKQHLTEIGITEFSESEVVMIPNNKIIIQDSENRATIEKLLDALNQDEDVQNVYHNIDNIAGD